MSVDMKNGEGLPASGEGASPEAPLGNARSGAALPEGHVGGKRAPRVQRVTLDEMVGLLNRELRESGRVDDGRTPMRLVMHSGPAEAPRAAVSGSATTQAASGANENVDSSDPDNIQDLPRPPKVPTIPGTRLLAPTVPSEPPGVQRPLSAKLKRLWPWLALALLSVALFGWPLYRHLLR